MAVLPVHEHQVGLILNVERLKNFHPGKIRQEIMMKFPITSGYQTWLRSPRSFRHVLQPEFWAILYVSSRLQLQSERLCIKNRLCESSIFRRQTFHVFLINASSPASCYASFAKKKRLTENNSLHLLQNRNLKVQ